MLRQYRSGIINPGPGHISASLGPQPGRFVRPSRSAAHSIRSSTGQGQSMPRTASSSAAAPSSILAWLERRLVSTTRSSPRDQEQQPAHTAGPTHLIVLVNGLFGSASNWDVMCEQLRQHLPPDTLLHPSTVNARFATYQGIDTCGQRLADEVRAVAAAHPSLTRLSVIAHSMGGLMARYALGALFNPGQGRVAGLQPCHFVSMATPHCGCDADGVAQVPFIGWTGDIPLLGQQLYRFLSSISGSTASLIFQRTGQQFFLLDGAAAAAAGAGSSDRAAVAKAATAADADRDAAAGGREGDGGSSSNSTAVLPLLLQMTQDCPDRGLFFYSALASFKTRTAYANMDGDHLVGFANSSLRSFDQLPPPPPTASTAKGVVLQDSLSAAFWPHDWQDMGQQWSSSSSSQQQLQQGASAQLGAAVSQPYAGSRDWSHAIQQQQQQEQRGLATAGASSTSQSEASGLWQVLSNKGSTDSSGEGGNSQQQQQQQQDAEHASGALAALELEAGGAGPAATAAVAAVGAAAAGSSGSSGGAAAATTTSPDDLHYSRFRAQPGRGGAPLKTAEESAAEAAAATAAPAAAQLTDSADEVLDLQYRNPLSPEPGQQQQQNALPSSDLPPKPQQQQQQQQQGATPAATAASGAAALAAAEADLASGLSRQASGPLPVVGSPAQAAADVAAAASRLAAASTVSSSGRAEVVSHMLQRLQELPWRRIDVSFQGARFGFAHNNIQVTRHWWNFEGVAVPAHLAQQLQLMDSLLLGPEGQQQQ